MDVYVYEDSVVPTLGPLITARPACDITIGTITLYEMLTPLGDVRRLLRSYLQHYVDRLGTDRIPHWGSVATSKRSPQKPVEGHVLFVNARLVPSRTNLSTLKELIDRKQSGRILAGETLAAALIEQRNNEVLLETFVSGKDSSEGLVEEIKAPLIDSELQLIQSPQDFLTAHENSIDDMVALAIDSGQYIESRPGLFLKRKGDSDTSTVIDDFVSIRSGPVLIDEDVTVGPFCCLDGPLKICSGTRIHPHSWLGPATVVGRDCRLAGEVTASVIEAFSNKSHNGFLGHSHLGSWVNLGAGTITSNLKVSYGTIRLNLSRNEILQTDRQFFGTLCGDFSKTAIHTSLPCGALIGAAATLAGSPAAFVPSLCSQLGNGSPETTATVEQVVTALSRMMSRRGIQPHPADSDLITAISELSTPDS